MNENIRNEIYSSYKEEFDFSTRLLNYVEMNFLSQANNNIITLNFSKEEQHAIALLTSEGIRLYKASLILISEGYASCAFVLSRSLVEIIFNIDYIIEDENKKYKRAIKYLNNKKLDEVWKRAELSLNKGLYSVYKMLCEFSHENSKSTLRNIIDGKYITGAINDEISGTVDIVNSIFYYLIYILHEYYKIDLSELEKINVPEKVNRFFEVYSTEKYILEKAFEIIKENFYNNLDKDKLKNEYKKYKINKNFKIRKK
ncbi:DUF5677 domain-containing protein [Clostridium perfringens]|uniref:DUF5677 domain-containing protein n=1 Tax=Clostridium perfringens TaxID=1502 RepID=UPI0013E3FE67|nr:DUF5677 domain-containing protein [Clostridium perfringens]MDK0830158.1 DUF5677 domain-containing protein [Clostridium perfringens]NGT03817.1 hypothetical protein [Clostridium perfringens]